MNFNKVILAGNLTRDPEVRYLPKGTAVARFGLAINRTWKNEAGEKKEEVTFVDVDSFGRTAEVIGQYFKKGQPILFEGRLKMDSWEDKQTGQRKQKLLVMLENFQFVGTKGLPGQGNAQGNAPEKSASAPASGTAPAAPGAEEDDVPF